MEKPYVISAELDLLAEDPSSVIDGEKIEKFRESLDADLRSLGKQTFWVGSNELKEGINSLVSKTKVPVISLDDRYAASLSTRLGVSRGVDDKLIDVGYVPRVGYPSISNQIDAIQVAGKEVVIVDDVIYSGEMLIWLCEELLRRRTIRVVGVIGGIAVGEGLERLDSNGISVEAVRAFDCVEGELCERDLAVAPGSGRRNDSSDFNVLYFDPVYGKPWDWASVADEDAYRFAANSYARSARVIKPGVTVKDIGRFKGLNDSAIAQDELLGVAQRLSTVAQEE